MMARKPDVTFVMAGQTDLANWMSKLPEHLHNYPLNQLAIPGSHNSFTYTLDPKSEVGPDLDGSIKHLVNLFGSSGKEVVYRWTVTQTLSVTQQLEHGIRYLDIRVGAHNTTKKIHFLHGLFGVEIDKSLEEINTFLDTHPKEVVILDFNHFYGMTEDDHQHLLTKLTDIFSTKLCPHLDLESVTMEMMWEHHLQVLVFYQDKAVKDNNFFWPSCSIISPWANTDNVNHLLSFLDNNYKQGRKTDTFYCWQGILTPRSGTLLTNFTSNLKECLVTKLAPYFVSWLKDKSVGSAGISICILDFVEMADFIPTVISLNR